MEELMSRLESLVDDEVQMRTSFAEVLEQAKRKALKRKFQKASAITGAAAFVVMSVAAATAPAVPKSDFDVALGLNRASYFSDFRLVVRSTPRTPDQLLAATLNIGFSQGFIDCYNGPARNYEATSVTELPEELTAASVANVCFEQYSIRDASSTYIVSTDNAVLLQPWAGEAGYLVLPQPSSVAICTAEESPQAIAVFPITDAVENASRLCQDNAMHPVDFSLEAEVRPAFAVEDSNAFMLWVARHSPATERQTVGFGRALPMSYWTGATPTLIDVEALWVRVNGYSGSQAPQPSEAAVPMRLVGAISPDGSPRAYKAFVNLP
ncbi:MAG: hypothetical protein RL441_191 [Actinomycetota bacterium]|jgi:hypothetical protein